MIYLLHPQGCRQEEETIYTYIVTSTYRKYKHALAQLVCTNLMVGCTVQRTDGSIETELLLKQKHCGLLFLQVMAEEYVIVIRIVMPLTPCTNISVDDHAKITTPCNSTVVFYTTQIIITSTVTTTVSSTNLPPIPRCRPVAGIPVDCKQTVLPSANSHN